MARKIKYIFYLLCVLNVSVVLYYFNARNMFHTDEQWSYAHANSTQGAYLSPAINSFMKDYNNDISGKWLNAKIFHDYLTVQENERFTYKHIAENLSVVEHPPLYFILLHTVGSFFPDMFNKWQGGALNIVFFALTLIMLYKLSKLFIKDDIIAMLPVFLWGFSEAGLATAIYLRMYALQTLLAVCLVYETLKMLRENEASNWRLLLIFLYSGLGILTQYNALFFSFFVATTAVVVLLCRKNWQLLWRYGLVMLCSVAVLFAVFPEAFDVLLFSQRGSELRGTLDSKNVSLLFFDRELGKLCDVYLMQFFCFHEVYSSIGVVFILLLTLALYAPDKNKDIRWLLTISLLFAFFMVCLMPAMYSFGLRYVMCIMPFTAILTVYLLIQGGVSLNVPRKYMAGFLGVLVLVNSILADFGKRSVFSFQADTKTFNLVNEMRGKKILAVSPLWAFFAGTYLYKDSERVFRTDDLCENQEVLNEADYVLVYHSIVKGSYAPKQVVGRKCTDNLAFIAVIWLSRDLNFEIYKVVKRGQEN